MSIASMGGMVIRLPRVHVSRLVALVIGYLIAYLALHWTSYIFVYPEFGVTPWDPKTGLSFLLAALMGPASFPVLFVTTSLGQYFTTPYADMTLIVTRGLLFALVYTLAGAGFARATAADRWGSIPQVLKLLGIGTVAAVLYGIAVVATIAWLSRMPSPWLLSAIVTSATGDLIGTMTIVPLYLAWRSLGAPRRAESGPLMHLAVGALLIFAASFVVFGLESIDQFKFFYLLLLPIVACALRYGFVGAALSIVATDIFMMAIITARDFEPGTATELQILMITLSATGLLLGSVVSERVRLSAELVESHQKLSAAQNRLLHASRVLLVNEMASAVAHEMNQPLSAVRNFIRAVQRMLPERNLDRAKVASLIDAAVAQVDAASAIINDTRRLVKRDADDHATASVSESADLCLRLLQGEMRSAGVSVRQEIGKDTRVHIQPVKLQQVLLNLLRNAIEALDGQETRLITIAARPAGDGKIEIAVSDTGPGFSEAIRMELFRPFATSKEEGLGLGLNLSRSIIEDHGGELWIADYRPGRTRIAFTLRAEADE
ncbi:MAG: MASE1 domain-containing protein [Rhizobiales bacterium]|nr:MASE1 domain-containing protein [Hyphomicrobiales bacterium]